MSSAPNVSIHAPGSSDYATKATGGARRLTQKSLAVLVGIDQGYLSRLLAGKRRPSPELAERLASRFGGHPWDWISDPGAMFGRYLPGVGAGGHEDVQLSVGSQD